MCRLFRDFRTPLLPLPALEPLIGRRAELAQLRTAFASGARLVTVIGPPGVGKSALAIAYAAAIAAEGASSVHLYDATEERPTGGDVPAGVAGAGPVSGFAHQAGPDPLPPEASHHAGPSLRVLDNVEASIEPAARALPRWLREAPGGCALVTSRERLGVAGEVVIELGPLPLEGVAPGEEGDAVLMLVDGARRARPGFEPDAGELEQLRAVAAAVEGLPLALALAAGRLRLFSPVQLLGRLERQLDALDRGGREGGGRHRSLRAAIGTSWSALGPHERATLAQCSALGGGFSLEAAEAAVDPGAFGAPPVFELLHALTDKSLLRAEAPAGGEGARFTMLACVREFAAEKLRAPAPGGERPRPARPPFGPPSADRSARRRRAHRPAPFRADAPAPPSAPAAPEVGPELVVAGDGRWFRRGEAEAVSLMKRRALRRLLQRLTEQRVGRPGEALSLQELLEAGWPGERTTYEAGNARVYNALTVLRKLGLRDALISRDDGYLLDPSAAVRLAPDAVPPPAAPTTTLGGAALAASAPGATTTRPSAG
jgi:predicted ATPase